MVPVQAHCVSAWGHDFRPDYKELGRVKVHNLASCPSSQEHRLGHCNIVSAIGMHQYPILSGHVLAQAAKFPNIPLLALTATATRKVLEDVKAILNIPTCPVFTVMYIWPCIRLYTPCCIFLHACLVHCPKLMVGATGLLLALRSGHMLGSIILLWVAVLQTLVVAFVCLPWSGCRSASSGAT